MSTTAGGAAAAGAMSKAIIAIVIAIAAVAVVAIAATVVVLSSGGPTGTVRNYIDSAVNDKPGSAFNDTVWSLNQSLYPAFKIASEITTEPNTTVDIHSLTEITKSQMTPFERTGMNATSHIIEVLFNVTVQDYCFVEYYITVTMTEHGVKEIHNSTGQFGLIQVKGSWLILFALDDLEEHMGHDSSLQASVDIAA